MSAPIQPVLLTAGLADIVNAQGSGLQGVIDAVRVGRGPLVGGRYVGYQPNSGMTALQGPMLTVPILQGSRLSPHSFRVIAVVPAEAPGGEYPINEVGFVLSTGTLLALWSRPPAGNGNARPLAPKTELADVEIAFELHLEALPANSVTITVEQPDIPDVTGVLAELLSTNARLAIELIRLERRVANAGL